MSCPWQDSTRYCSGWSRDESRLVESVQRGHEAKVIRRVTSRSRENSQTTSLTPWAEGVRDNMKSLALFFLTKAVGLFDGEYPLR